MGNKFFTIDKIKDRAMIQQGRQGDKRDQGPSLSDEVPDRYHIGTAEGDSLVINGDMSDAAFGTFLQHRLSTLQLPRQSCHSQTRESSTVARGRRSDRSHRDEDRNSNCISHKHRNLIE